MPSAFERTEKGGYLWECVSTLFLSGGRFFNPPNVGGIAWMILGATG
jgi:hypothetical protein